MLTSAPPLLPTLTAASVWINDWFIWSYSFRSLDLELIIPAVTVEFRLYGLPTARTHSPIWLFSESPNKIYSNFSLESIFKTATSVTSSEPTIIASYSLLSFVVTITSLEFSITWWLVIIYPSGDIITPDPVPTLFLESSS